MTTAEQVGVLCAQARYDNIIPIGDQNRSWRRVFVNCSAAHAHFCDVASSHFVVASTTVIVLIDYKAVLCDDAALVTHAQCTGTQWISRDCAVHVVISHVDRSDIVRVTVSAVELAWVGYVHSDAILNLGCGCGEPKLRTYSVAPSANVQRGVALVLRYRSLVKDAMPRKLSAVNQVVDVKA